MNAGLVPTATAVDGEMTIYRAAELKAQLLQALERAGPVLELDLSGVTEIDIAGLQLLQMLKAEAAQSARTLQLVCVSVPVHELLSLLELVDHFGPPALVLS
ncbi:STAS domain-containing protein [Aquabacterium humicola]|uniref:STAS domain-containing protein n=1 Tax=Aquabacterium humicola TaxID=3237377 RepID=UPI0025430FC7|nr:STAS domain-containing protein [Rubrivivax pictus]